MRLPRIVCVGVTLGCVPRGGSDLEPAASSGGTAIETGSADGGTAESESGEACPLGSSPAGGVSWSFETYDAHRCTHIAALPNGDIALMGVWSMNDWPYEVVVASYAPDGTQRWLQRYANEEDVSATPVALAVDDAESILVFIVEELPQVPAVYRPVLLRLALDGTQTWRHVWEDVVWGYDGDVVVTNGSEPLLVLTDYTRVHVRQLDASAHVVREWTRELSVPSYVWGVAASRTGTVLAWGPTMDFTSYMLERFDAQGMLIWSAEHEVGHVAIADDDRVFISSSSEEGPELLVYDPQGTVLLRSPVPSGRIVPRCDGGAFIAGAVASDDGFYDHWLMSIDADGNSLWHTYLDLPDDSYLAESSIGLAPAGDLVGCFPLGGGFDESFEFWYVGLRGGP